MTAVPSGYKDEYVARHASGVNASSHLEKGHQNGEPKNLKIALGWKEEGSRGSGDERGTLPLLLVTRKTSKQTRMGDNGW